MALTPKEQQELEELELAELEALDAASAEPAQPADIPLSQIDLPTPWGGTFNPMAAANTVKNMGLEAGGGAAGQAIGAATGPLAPAAIPILGAIGAGAGNAIGQLTTPGKDFSLGEVGGAAVAGAIPGAPVAAGGAKLLAKQAGKSALGNLAATTVQTGIDEQRLPTAGEALGSAAMGYAAPYAGKALGAAFGGNATQDAFNSKRNAVLTKWRAAGGVIDPEAVDKGIPIVGMIAGKEGTAQAASIKNQRVVNRLIREELGLKGEKPITTDTLDYIREEAGIAYQKVASLSKQAASDLENLKQARFNAKELGEAYKASGNPQARTEWLAAKQTAEAIEQLIEGHALAAGRKDLIPNLAKARKAIAQSYDVEVALNPSNGFVDANVLAGGYNGRNMTGKLQLVADAANDFGQYLREPSRIGAPGASRLGAYSGANAMANGVTPAAAAAFTFPLLGKPARKFILGGRVQDYAAKQTPKQYEKIAAAMARIGTLSTGRNLFMDQQEPQDELAASVGRWAQ